MIELSHVEAAAARRDKWILVAVLAGVVVSLGALAYPMATGAMYVNSDIAYYHVPLRQFYQASLTNGEAFSWMPSILNGYYIQGEGQVGMYHPVHLLLYRFLPLDRALNLEVFLSYPFMLLGLFLFLRAWKLPSHAALFGAFAFCFSGYNIFHGMHINLIAVVAHIPALLYAIDRAVRAQRRRDFLLGCTGVTLLTVSQLLLGFPQSVYFSLIAEFLYLVFLCFWILAERRSCVPTAWHAVGRLLTLFPFKALALLIAAVQLLPTWEFVNETERLDYARRSSLSFSLHPSNTLQFLGPYFFKSKILMTHMPHEAVLYPGVAVAVLMLWAVTRPLARWPSKRDHSSNTREARPFRRLLLYSLGLGTLALVLAFGSFGYLYPYLLDRTPLGIFRAPGRHTVLFNFAVAVAAAVGFAELAKAATLRRPIPWLQRAPILLLPAGSWAFALFVFGDRAGISPLPVPEWMAGYLASNTMVLVSPVLATVTAVLALLAMGGRLVPLVLIAIISAADLALCGLPYFFGTPPEELTALIEEEKPLPPLSHGQRYYGRENNLPVLKGLINAGGYIGPKLKRNLAMDFNHPTALRIAGVRWYNSRRHWPPRKRSIRWKEIKNPVPMARLVTNVRVSKNAARDIERVDVGTTALVSEPLPIPRGDPGQASIVHRETARISVLTDSASRQLLVLAESYHAGWKVKVDGVEQPVVPVYGDFLGCVVDAGIHAVYFSFEPSSLATGRWLSVLGLGVLACSGFGVSRWPLGGAS